MRYFLLVLFVYFGQLDAQESKYSNHISIPNSFTKPEIDSAYLLADNIDTVELKRVLSFLASDSCQGRELGTKGNDIAADFIARTFEEYKIPKLKESSDYFQSVKFSWHSWKSTSFSADGFDYRQIWDYIAIPEKSSSLSIQTDTLLFLGYGVESPGYNDYTGINAKGKTILIYNGEPRTRSGKYLITGNNEPSIWSGLDKKIKAAHKHGVNCIIIIEENFKILAEENRASLYSPVVVLSRNEIDLSRNVNRLHISSTMLSKILGAKQKKLISAREKIIKSGKPKPLYLPIQIKADLQKEVIPIIGRNILAYFEGTDKKDELIIITAHYDHIGMRGQDVFNGADDNASGTSGVMQIARTLQMASDKGIKPRRSILCMLVTGEEKGLLGSMYYVNQPVFPLSNTMVNINMDMIGRADDKYKTSSKFSYVIGSDRLSKDLHKFNETINNKYSHLLLDYTYNAENDPNRYYYRSDHYNFAEKGIPAIFFFSGVHEDYHRITDDIEKIQFVKYKNIVRHIFLLTWGLANREEKLVLN
ncbi:MAG: M28 family peptidase [Saprospiraceae bacterium]|nr:M28 family peptidase [Saprospiraceae bacterium]